MDYNLFIILQAIEICVRWSEIEKNETILKTFHEYINSLYNYNTIININKYNINMLTLYKVKQK